MNLSDQVDPINDDTLTLGLARENRELRDKLEKAGKIRGDAALPSLFSSVVTPPSIQDEVLDTLADLINEQAPGSYKFPMLSQLSEEELKSFKHVLQRLRAASRRLWDEVERRIYEQGNERD